MKAKTFLMVFLSLSIIFLFSSCAKQYDNSNDINIQDTQVNSADNNASKQGGQTVTIISGNSQSNAATVIIRDSSFIPATTFIKAGTKVRWINQDSITHAIKSDKVNSPPIGSAQTFEYEFDTTGTYEYTCGIHPSIRGKIVVE